MFHTSFLVAEGDNLHDTSNPVFQKNKKIIISFCLSLPDFAQ